MIHEGTHGIQALDLLGRKVRDGRRARARSCWPRAIDATIERAAAIAALADARQGAGRGAGSASPRRRARPGRPAIRARRWPTPCPTCRPSATWCWPGSGSTWRLRAGADATQPMRQRGPARRLPLLLPLRAAEDRRLARRRRDAATPPARRWPRSRSEACRPARIDTLIWVLIYGGLFVARLGLALRRAPASPRPGVVIGVGVVAAIAVGVVLIWVRSRMPDAPAP